VAGLVIKDGNGTIVYEQGLAPSLNEDTSSGSTGTWTIVVALNEYSGTLNFRVQKKLLLDVPAHERPRREWRGLFVWGQPSV
jgi:hypothetical protein